MPQIATKRRTGFLVSACCGVLIASASAADTTEFGVPDAISQSCIPVGTFEGSTSDWISRDFPTEIHVDIIPAKQRAWIENLLKALTSNKKNIQSSARKKFKATVSWEIDGHRCEHPAEVRLNGDMRDHISYQGSTVIASVSIKLLGGHVGHIVRFKLLLPETRAGENEILAILLYREFGFISPETRFVTGYLNGIKTPYLFQESPAKEFMEANYLRESLLVEGDERWRWVVQSRADVYRDVLLKNTPRVENRVFARADNRGWLDNPTSSMIGTTGLTAANLLYNQYHIDKPTRSGGESHLGLTSSYRLEQNGQIIRNESLFVLLAKVIYASHGLRVHNRKFYYDPTYQDLIPIYYDGMALQDKDNLNAQFPLNGVFPESEINLVATRLSDESVRDNIYAALRERGGAMTRDRLDTIMDTVLERTLALEPRLEDAPAEPPQFEELGLPLLLAEETGDYQFYGYNIDTGRFQLCAVTQEFENGRRPTCTNTTAETKQILAEPVAMNGDPIPFVGGFVRSDTGGFILRQPQSRNTHIERNPASLDVTVSADKLLILDFDSNFPNGVVPKYRIRIDASHASAGKLLVRGEVPADAEFLVSGTGGAAVGVTRYDKRLLTGCVTFIDATLDNARISAASVPCEDSVNFVRTEGVVSYLLIDGASADAVDADFSDITFQNIEITKAANDCIDLSAGHYRVANLVADGCGDKGLSVGEKAVVFLDYLQITDAIFGAVAKDSSYLYLEYADFTNVDTCFAAYRKKQEFDGARIEFSKRVQSQCPASRMQIQAGSVAEVAVKSAMTAKAETESEKTETGKQ